MNKYLFQTKYFNNSWTWFKRLLEFLVACAFLGWFRWQELMQEEVKYPWIKYVFFVLLTVYIFVRPKDELALDKNNLYYIKRSVWSFLSKVRRYEL